MSIKQNGGVFGRNPTFNNVTIDGDLIINDEIFSGLDYQGGWNASTNSPTLVSSTGTKGEFYIVSVTGTTSLDGVSNWGVGDWALFSGTVWQRIEGGASGNFVNVTASGSIDGIIGAVTPNAATVTSLTGTTNLDFSTASGASALKMGKSNSTADSEVGVQARADGLLYVTRASGVGILYGNENTGGASQEAIRFVRNASDVGSVDTTSTATAYNTSSDPRLKSEFTAFSPEEAWDMFDGIYATAGKFNFISEPEKEVWGFDAHKLIDLDIGLGSEGYGPRDLPIKTILEPEVIDPETGEIINPAVCVTPAGVDQAKMVPNLMAVIQDLRNRLSALENK